MQLSKKEEYSWAKVKQYVEEQLYAYITPRQADVVRVAKKFGLSAKKAIAMLKKAFPAYQSTGRPKFPWPVKHYRNQIFSFYGTVAIDLAFFGKQGYELRALGVSKAEYSPALVMIDVATRFAIVEVVGHRGKSAKGLLAAMKRAFEKYKQQYQIYPKLVLSDQEAGIMSGLMKDYLASTHTQLKVFTYSRKKSFMAENLIRILRSSLATLKKFHSNKKVTWMSLIGPVIDG